VVGAEVDREVGDKVGSSGSGVGARELGETEDKIWEFVGASVGAPGNGVG